MLDRLISLVRSFGELRLVVVGDVFLDEYVWGTARRLSPEAPVPIVSMNGNAYRTLGGAGNAATNVLAMGAGCDLCSALGADRTGKRVHDLAMKLGLGGAWVTEAGRTTGCKMRVAAGGQQIVRLDFEMVRDIEMSTQCQLHDAVKSSLCQANGLIFEDYSKGVLTDWLVRQSIIAADEAGVPTFVDPKYTLAPYRGVSLAKVNLEEAHLLAHTKSAGEAAMKLQDYIHGGDVVVTQRLQDCIHGGDVVVTQGAEGMLAYDGTQVTDIPTTKCSVRDVQGAGDTAMAALALARCAGANLLEAAVIANAAAGVVVKKPGTATASRDEIIEALPDAVGACYE